jgi:hypothetical protein
VKGQPVGNEFRRGASAARHKIGDALSSPRPEPETLKIDGLAVTAAKSAKTNRPLKKIGGAADRANRGGHQR